MATPEAAQLARQCQVCTQCCWRWPLLMATALTLKSGYAGRTSSLKARSMHAMLVLTSLLLPPSSAFPPFPSFYCIPDTPAVALTWSFHT